MNESPQSYEHPPDAPDFQSGWFVTEGDRTLMLPTGNRIQNYHANPNSRAIPDIIIFLPAGIDTSINNQLQFFTL